MIVTIPGTPPLWRRARLARGGSHYTDAATRADEARVAAAARGIRMPDGPIRLHIVAIWPRPKARPPMVPVDVWKLGCALRKPTTPDADNVAKAVADGLTKAGVWADDGVVSVLQVETWYAGVNNVACTVVTVEPVGWV